MAGFDIEQFVVRSNEPRWLTDMRERALSVIDASSVAERFAAVAADLDLRHDLAAHESVAVVSNAVAEEQTRRLAELGVVFCDIDTALRDHAPLVEEFLGTVVAPDDNEFAALNTVLWTGGSFVYVPRGVDVDVPLQATSRLASEPPGQFERTLIVADEGARVSFLSGCSAPVYTRTELHAAVVEVVVRPHARVTCTAIQYWSANVDHVVTKRARVEERGHIEWIDGNIGARRTSDRTTVHLVGEGASGEVHSVSAAGDGQHRETVVELLHAAPNTRSAIVAKAIRTDGGTTTCQSRVRVAAGAVAARVDISCEDLAVDAGPAPTGRSEPDTEIAERCAVVHHETTASEISDEQRFFLMSRGLSEEDAVAVIVNGFIEPITGLLPVEYAVEWSRLIELVLDGSVG